MLVDYNAYWVRRLTTTSLYSGDVGLAAPGVAEPRCAARHLLPRPALRQGGLLVNSWGANDYAYIRRHGTVVAYYNAQYVYALRLAARSLQQWTGRRADGDGAGRRRADGVRAASGQRSGTPAAQAFADTTTIRDPSPGRQRVRRPRGVEPHRAGASALDHLANTTGSDYGNTIADTTSGTTRTGATRERPRLSVHVVRRAARPLPARSRRLRARPDAPRVGLHAAASGRGRCGRRSARTAAAPTDRIRRSTRLVERRRAGADAVRARRGARHPPASRRSR